MVSCGLCYDFERSLAIMLFPKNFLQLPKVPDISTTNFQNKIIQICGDQIINVLLKRINDCEYFSVKVDETTDISA